MAQLLGVSQVIFEALPLEPVAVWVPKTGGASDARRGDAPAEMEVRAVQRPRHLFPIPKDAIFDSRSTKDAEKFHWVSGEPTPKSVPDLSSGELHSSSNNTPSSSSREEDVVLLRSNPFLLWGLTLQFCDLFFAQAGTGRPNKLLSYPVPWSRHATERRFRYQIHDWLIGVVCRLPPEAHWLTVWKLYYQRLAFAAFGCLGIFGAGAGWIMRRSSRTRRRGEDAGGISSRL